MPRDVTELFDGQARDFDQRAGLPDEWCRRIAAGVLEAGKIGRGDLIVEIGAGTGQIGAELAASRRYIGVDRSFEMLRRFRERLTRVPGAHVLVRADANRVWPVASKSARVVFASRALHLLDRDWVAEEVCRVAARVGATLITGRIERAPDSVRERMAVRMRSLLRARGLQPRGDRDHCGIVDALVSRGAVPLDPVTAASRRVTVTARMSLEAWRRLPGLGGVSVTDEVRAEVVEQLAAWASDAFGGLDRPLESQEAYVLRPCKLIC